MPGWGCFEILRTPVKVRRRDAVSSVMCHFGYTPVLVFGENERVFQVIWRTTCITEIIGARNTPADALRCLDVTSVFAAV